MRASKLTKNQQAALRCFAEVDRFTVPPECGGQIVEVSYGCSPDFIYERSYDQSDRTVTITAYAHPARECEFDPWNGAPATGRYVGVIFRGPVGDEPRGNARE